MVGVIVLFSFSVAASLLWLAGVGFYVYAKIGFSQLFGLALPEIVMIAATTFLPIIFLWLVVGLLYNVLTLRKQGSTINLLLAQTRKSSDHAEAMVRTLMETQLQTRSAMVLHNADLFINELNDFLSEIVVRLGLIQPAHTELVWQRVGDGNRWAFCKVVLQKLANSPNFDDDLKNQLQRDEILSRSIRTFCYRFEQMFTMLERHDTEHYLTKIFEEGSLGRVYLCFVEACRELDQKKAFFEQQTPAYIEEPMDFSENSYQEESQEMPAQTIEESFERAFEEGFEASSYESAVSESQEFLAQESVSYTYEEEVAPAPEQKEQTDSASPFGFLRPTR